MSRLSCGDVAPLLVDDARRWLRVVAACWPVDVERRCAASCAVMRTTARPLRHAQFFFGGGRRPAAAPASLRRCRDDRSDFF
ncbi:hypothetical protein F511_46129 [Dorcoceras hygrometricum]|uniref:Uncharacterized protein n=1 Tax=Dorcoceras hygrometricum TaxID=472368 RepID=A0A2Z6ZUA3_9LAMI|nr:hypothetical protein F511_46129 [Dorcoceras hygrometricum]